MWKRFWLALSLSMAFWAGSAGAQIVPGGDRPVFTVDEQSIIERNAALRGLIRKDPRLVRRVLNAIAHGEQTSEPALEARERSAGIGQQTPDPRQNPDLKQLERVSPEAAHALFLLIKQAGNKNKSPAR